MSDDDDVPQLSAETFNILQEFYKDEEEKQNRLKVAIENVNNTNVVFEENWQLSQFWYDDGTVDKMVDVVEKCTCSNAKIALISCPTLYKKMKTIHKAKCEVNLFEYDERFVVYGTDFILYDYKNPLSIPRDKNSYYDLVIADPPFLSEECLTKTAVTIKFLTKSKIMLCTGSVMSELAERLLNVHIVRNFKPKHKNNLGNEFFCYSNFNVDLVLSM